VDLGYRRGFISSRQRKGKGEGKREDGEKGASWLLLVSAVYFRFQMIIDHIL
jgi:hypothetical protein